MVIDVNHRITSKTRVGMRLRDSNQSVVKSISDLVYFSYNFSNKEESYSSSSCNHITIVSLTTFD